MVPSVLPRGAEIACSSSECSGIREANYRFWEVGSSLESLFVGVAFSRGGDPLPERWFPVVVEKVGQLGAECCHLAREALDPLHKCVAVGEWRDSRQRRLGCGLDNAVCTAACCIQAALGLAGENGPYVGG